ncbi:MAG: redoxin domain-containing protein [Phycisphaerae bacterium]|nr:redoxin domain-containing protein [Phycisphaerae bacterium]
MHVARVCGFRILVAVAIGLASRAGLHAAEIPIGQEVPTFELPGTDGTFHALERSPGKKGSVIVFYSNRCGICRSADGKLKELAREFEPKGLAFIAINCGNYIENPGETFDDMKRRAQSAGFPFPYVLDIHQAVARAYGVRRTPEVFVVDPNRRLLFHGGLVAGHDAPADGKGGLRDALTKIVENQPVESTRLKSYGSALDVSVHFRAAPRSALMNPGDIVRPFGLMAADGSFWQFKPDYRWPNVVFVFMSFGCEESAVYEDRLIALAKDFTGKGGPQFVIINSNDPKARSEDAFEKLKARAAQKSYPFPVLVDSTQDVAKMFGVTTVPAAVLADFTGSVRYVGAIDDNKDASKVREEHLRNALRALYGGLAPTPNKTAPVGCEIAWRRGNGGR